MNEFKWNEDDFEKDIIEEEQPKKEKRKFGIKTLAASIALTMVISISGYALLNPAITKFVEGFSKNNSVAIKQNDESINKALENITPNAVATPLNQTPTGEKMEIPDIADKVGPAVVGVINKTTYANSFPYSYYGFAPDGTQTEIEQGSGSGILISADGYVVTNHHVVEGATSLSVILSTGTEYTATLIGSDERTDLALLKIEGDSFPYATFGDSNALRVGELCVVQQFNNCWI